MAAGPKAWNMTGAKLPKLLQLACCYPLTPLPQPVCQGEEKHKRSLTANEGLSQTITQVTPGDNLSGELGMTNCTSWPKSATPGRHNIACRPDLRATIRSSSPTAPCPAVSVCICACTHTV